MIRVHFILDTVKLGKYLPYFEGNPIIEQMPFVPRLGDSFSLSDITTDIPEAVKDFDWIVTGVIWRKDKEGYYAVLLLGIDQ